VYATYCGVDIYNIMFIRESVFTRWLIAYVFLQPHNPTGKVFTRAELELISKIVKKYPNVVIVCDEVSHVFEMYAYVVLGFTYVCVFRCMNI